jgi:site-specific recombinase XerD
MKGLKYDIQEYGKGYRIYVGNGKYRKASTKLKAAAIVSELKMARAKRGREMADLSPSLVVELVKFHHQCLGAGTTIEDAVKFWLPYYKAKSASVPLADAIDQFLVHKKMEESTKRERKHRLGLWLSAQPDPETTVFDAARVELLRGFIDDEENRTTAASARNVWAVISAFCTWAKHTDLLDSNPCERIAKPEPGERAVDIMEPDEVAALLRLTVEHYDREIISYVVLSLFAGLRPHEFTSLQKDETWLCLDWKAFGKKLSKDKRLGKIKQARTIPINPTLLAWVDYIREREGGILSGSVIDGYVFYQRFRRWKRRHYPDDPLIPGALPPIENDILRHCYGTYRVAQLGEIGPVAMEMGNSESMIRQHYNNGEKDEFDAEKYWALTPAVVLETN